MTVASSVLSMTEPPVALKLVFIGDENTGRTSLLDVYERGDFIDGPHRPTIFHNRTKNVQYTYGGRLRNVDLQLWDTAGHTEYAEARMLAYPGAHVVVIVFSVVEPDSLANVKSAWIEEARTCCPGIPVILVGAKTDEREDNYRIEALRKRNLHAVTYTEGVTMAKKIGAKAYIECSAKWGYNVKAVFDEAMNVFFRNEEKTTTCCTSFSLLSRRRHTEQQAIE